MAKYFVYLVDSFVKANIFRDGFCNFNKSLVFICLWQVWIRYSGCLLYHISSTTHLF